MTAALAWAGCGDDTDSGPAEPTWHGLVVGQPCDGVGECGTGTVELTPAGGAICSTMPAGSAAEHVDEVCDRLDNDCDGTIDNLPGAPAADLTAGVCAGVTKICIPAGGWDEPDYTTVPSYETVETACDELDNDCDGDVDEACDCSDADADGLFSDCTICDAIGRGCDSISAGGPTRRACDCVSASDCPCGLSCSCLQIGPGVSVCDICVR